MRNMKFGKLPPIPEDKDLSHWCPFDALEVDDYFPMLGYLGSCSICADGRLKVPPEFLVEYLGDTENGVHHIFQTIETIKCSGCGGIVDELSVLCQSQRIGLDVTKEFHRIEK